MKKKKKKNTRGKWKSAQVPFFFFLVCIFFSVSIVLSLSHPSGNVYIEIVNFYPNSTFFLVSSYTKTRGEGKKKIMR